VKRIKKRREPPALVAWKQQANDDWTPTYAELAEPPRDALVPALLDEQGCICCYCMRRISAADSHVEHFRPQGQYPELALTYSNLHASCQGEYDRSPPVHCGHHKANLPLRGSDDEAALIAPTDRNCENRFRYTGAGEIHPIEEADDGAARTIAILNLGDANLNRQRKRAFDAALQFIDITSFEDVEAEISMHKTRSADGRFTPFCIGIIYLLKWCLTE
jgi:uncharacterized protein (TIGR02646 family)